MKFDPNNELSDKELDSLAEKDFDEFLDYLDQKAAHLKKFTKPLDAHHLKQYASHTKYQTKGEALTTEEIQNLQKLAKENEMKSFDDEKHTEWIEKKNDMLKKTGVKNVKTNRKQWFD